MHTYQVVVENKVNGSRNSYFIEAFTKKSAEAKILSRFKPNLIKILSVSLSIN